MNNSLPACISAIAIFAALTTPSQSSAQGQRSVPAEMGSFVALLGDPADGTVTTLLTPLTITSGTPVNGKLWKYYASQPLCGYPCRPYRAGFSVTAAGGTPPYLWAWKAQVGSSLPPGLTFSNVPTRLGCVRVSQPAICGSLTKAGTFKVLITVTDSASPPHHAIGSYTINIYP